MADKAGDKKGLMISLLLLAAVAIAAILIFWLMLGRTTGVDGNKTKTPGAAIFNLLPRG